VSTAPRRSAAWEAASDRVGDLRAELLADGTDGGSRVGDGAHVFAQCGERRFELGDAGGLGVGRGAQVRKHRLRVALARPAVGEHESGGGEPGERGDDPAEDEGERDGAAAPGGRRWRGRTLFDMGGLFGGSGLSGPMGNLGVGVRTVVRNRLGKFGASGPASARSGATSSATAISAEASGAVSSTTTGPSSGGGASGSTGAVSPTTTASSTVSLSGISGGPGGLWSDDFLVRATREPFSFHGREVSAGSDLSPRGAGQQAERARASATTASSIAGPSGVAAMETDAADSFHAAAAFALIVIKWSGAFALRISAARRRAERGE
jgi:hypothetical protein